MNHRLIEAIQVAGDGVIIELRRQQPFTNKFFQIDLSISFFQMNEGLTTA